MGSGMLTSDFDFHLPKKNIAQEPKTPRDRSRLLVVNNTLTDHLFNYLPKLLLPGDTLVLNDTKVLPARLCGQRNGSKIEITLHMRRSERNWLAFARPAKKLRLGDEIHFGTNFSATVSSKYDGGEISIEFKGVSPIEGLKNYGKVPLPPYIKRENINNDKDFEDYQTVYASQLGAVAAPTAGLHYTPDLLLELQSLGIKIEKLTLHVGAGTFLPVKVDHIDKHVMHSEWGKIDQSTADRINGTKANGGRIIAAGTTVLRLLESAANETGEIQPFEGTTDIFITPGFQFRAVDVLQTNFHLPRSTLFMLVSAFSGLENVKKAYQHAITEGYRFYSYGDSCLLERANK